MGVKLCGMVNVIRSSHHQLQGHAYTCPQVLAASLYQMALVCLNPCKCVQALVETSMLAAISGLLYLITATLGIDGSFLFSYMLPFPIVVASLRRGHAAAWSTMGISACLVLGASFSAHATLCLASLQPSPVLFLHLDYICALVHRYRVTTQRHAP